MYRRYQDQHPGAEYAPQIQCQTVGLAQQSNPVSHDEAEASTGGGKTVECVGPQHDPRPVPSDVDSLFSARPHVVFVFIAVGKRFKPDCGREQPVHNHICVATNG